MKVAILYFNFLCANGTQRMLGGVETYLWNLAKLILERGDEPVLFQPAAGGFEKRIGHLRVIGVDPRRGRVRRNTRKDLYEAALSFIDTNKDVIVFGADHASIRGSYPRAVSIQHGVAWDLPGRFLRGRLGRIPLMPDWVCKRYGTYRCYLYFNNCRNRVCVDYNFLNWYRAQVTDVPRGKIWVIPNFADTPNGYRPDMERHHRKPVRVLFARRFVEYRGSRVMIEAARRLLSSFQGVEVCFAGEGPDSDLIAASFANEPRVSIRKYAPDESLHVHEGFEIAVVPSLASEGTSFSLAEAMAAGCAVVASNVGGMTNMILDGYNGRLVDPNTESVTEALTELVPDPDRRLKLAKRAAETAREAFSLDRWKRRWSEVLDHVQKMPLEG